MSCPCGIAVGQPWHARKSLWSPASLIGGVVLAGFGVAALVGFNRWLGVALLIGLGVAILVAAVVQGGRGHRGWCLVRRAGWFGLAAPGVPVRMVFSLGV
jgi:putative Mn2+ efflux pump MntP